MSNKLTEQQISEIVEKTMLELQEQGITDRETVKTVVAQQIEKAKQDQQKQQDNLRFMVEDLVNEMSQSKEDTKGSVSAVPAEKTKSGNEEIISDDIKISTIPSNTGTISPDENIEKKKANQTAAQVAKRYLDDNRVKHHNNVNSEKQDVKDIWTVRQDRKKNLKSVDENKELSHWQKKLLKAMNKPMKLMDYFVRICGKSFEPIFCIIIPIIVMLFPIYYVAIGLVNQVAVFVTLVFIAIFLFFLMFLPKVATAVEFPILGFYIICKSGFLRWLVPSAANFIDPSGWLTYAPGHHPLNSSISGYALVLGWVTVIAAIIFIIGKIIFFIYLKLKQYRRRYMVRHHHRKKYVAQLDKNSEVLM